MVFSNPRNWINITAVFFERQRKCRNINMTSVKLMKIGKNAPFCLSIMTWKINGVGIEKSDIVTFCGGAFFDVEGISWKFFQIILSCWISVSGWSNCCNTLIRPNSCFLYFWIVASIPPGCCNRECSFSACVCSDDKISEKCCCNSTDVILTCPVKFSEKENSVWDLQRILFYSLSCVFVWFHRCFTSRRFSTLLSLIIIIIIVNFKRSTSKWINSSVSTWFHDFSREIAIFRIQKISVSSMRNIETSLWRKLKE